MIHYLRVIAFSALFAIIMPGASSAQDLPIPQEWSTYYAWFLIKNEEYIPSSPPEEAAVNAAHIQYQLLLQETGQSVVAGGLGPGSGSQIVGLTILRASSLSEAQSIACGDPAVISGRYIALVREWWVPSGKLP